MRDSGIDAQYVQGMNVIAAPFLYAARSEVEAFSLFSVFIQRECPGYVKPTMEGVHRGLKVSRIYVSKIYYQLPSLIS